MLKSVESNIRAFVKFINASERTLEVLWINFRGEGIHYSNLAPRTSCMVRKESSLLVDVMSAYLRSSVFYLRLILSALIRGYLLTIGQAIGCRSTTMTFFLPMLGTSLS